MLDNSFDNLQVVMEQKLLKQYYVRKKNVVLMDIICFEYILLEFENLLDWIYAPNDEFLSKRASAISAREKLITCIDAGSIRLSVYDKMKSIYEGTSLKEQFRASGLEVAS